MREFSFAECGDHVSISGAFGPDSVIVTDGSLQQLPRLSVQRHGNPAHEVNGTRIEIPGNTRGNISIFIGADNTHITIGPDTRLICNIRMWRHSKLHIAEKVTVNNARFVCDRSEIIVGRDCMFSDEILIQSADQHGIVDLATNEIINNKPRRIEIGEHVWVGRRVTVMPDVKIGDGSILGTGCVVTGDVPPCSAAVGIPARTIRGGTSWCRLPGRIAPIEQEFFDRMRANGVLEEAQT